MVHRKIGSSWQEQHIVALMAGLLLAGGFVALLVVSRGSVVAFETVGVTTANRALNQLIAVAITCIALIIPLTANLYTPRLVKLYVTHPLIVWSLVFLMIGHALTMGSHYLTPGSRSALVLAWAITGLYIAGLVAGLPFLYGLSRFLRPSFFVPMLTRKGLASLRNLNHGKKVFANSQNLCETIDVVTNIALTGMARGDRQLVLLALQSLHTMLTELVGSAAGETVRWRDQSPAFVPGLAREGQEFLARQRLWPEAYVLAQMLKVVEGAGRRDHELLAELAGHLVDTAQLAGVLGREQVVELHIMAFNALMRQAVEDKDLRRFQNLSYHYRLLIEAFHDAPERLHAAAGHLLHYARMAARTGLAFGLETVIYDVGELVLSVARFDEGRAQEIVQAWAGPLLQDSLDQPGLRKVAWRTLLRVHWEAKASGLDQVAQAIYWRFLTDEPIHREQLELVLDENRALHYEFNDRLMRFAHFSPEAVDAAQGFLGSW